MKQVFLIRVNLVLELIISFKLRKVKRKSKKSDKKPKFILKEQKKLLTLLNQRIGEKPLSPITQLFTGRLRQKKPPQSTIRFLISEFLILYQSSRVVAHRQAPFRFRLFTRIVLIWHLFLLLMCDRTILNIRVCWGILVVKRMYRKRLSCVLL